MRERLYITITDVKGSKHYTFNQIVKKYFLYFIAMIFLIFFILGGSVVMLRREVIKYEHFQGENERLLVEIGKAEEKIWEKEMDLENLNEKLIAIEGIISSDNVGGIENIDERLDIALLTASEKRHLLNIIPSGNPIVPFKGYTSKYGSRYHPVLKKRAYHWGLDYRAKIGTQLIAPADGVVKFAGKNGTFGNLTIISHAYGFETYYAHQDKIEVKVGDVVHKGDKIGLTGNTGRSTGPHLHYEIHYLGKKLDPMSFAQWDFENYDTLFKSEEEIKWQSLVSLIRNQYKILQVQQQ